MPFPGGGGIANRITDERILEASSTAARRKQDRGEGRPKRDSDSERGRFEIQAIQKAVRLGTKKRARQRQLC